MDGASFGLLSEKRTKNGRQCHNLSASVCKHVSLQACSARTVIKTKARNRPDPGNDMSIKFTRSESALKSS